METAPHPPRKRRRTALSVRGLLLLVLAVGLWLGWAAHKARRQRLAVEAVRKFGGFVHYDWQFDARPVIVSPGNHLWFPSWGKFAEKRKPPAPGWLRRAVGDEYFQEIAHVSLFTDLHKMRADATFYNKGPADDALETLSTQTGIRTLQVGGQQITDANLAHVGKMTGLEELIIFPGYDVSKAGVAHLAGLKNLRMLFLSKSDVSDEGMKHLSALTKLQDLAVEGRAISDDGLEAAGRLKDLESLWLSGTNATDRGLDHLTGLKKLRHLRLDSKLITDRGKARLKAALPGLEIE